MYNTKQLKKGVTNPKLIKKELIKKKHKIDSYRRFDYAITGAYWTGNIGDRAISIAIKNELEQKNKTTRLFHSDIEKTNSAVHILGGGGVLRDCRAAAEKKSADNLRKNLNWVSKSNRGAIIGVGVPGFKRAESKSLVKNKLKKVDVITVRDHWSYDNIKEFYDGNVYVTTCPTFLLDDPQSKNINRTGVNFRPWPNYPNSVMSYHFEYDDKIDIDDAKDKYIKNIQRLCDNIDYPVFIPFSNEDEKFAQRHLSIDTLPYEFSVEKTLKRISAVDKMVAMRYHSLVFSAITRTPVVALAYQPKVSSLANRLDVQSYLPTDSDISLSFEIPSNLDKLKHLSSKNFELIGKL